MLSMKKKPFIFALVMCLIMDMGFGVVSLVQSFEKASYSRGFNKSFGEIFYTSNYGIL